VNLTDIATRLQHLDELLASDIQRGGTWNERIIRLDGKQ